MGELDIDKSRFTIRDLEKLSSKIAEKTHGIEVNLRDFEEKMRELEIHMPPLDEAKIRVIETKALELEMLLTDIAGSI